MITQSILNGLVLGGIYILVALGLTIVLSIMGIVQLAHGEIYMLGAYAMYYLCARAGLNFFLAILISALLVGGLGVFLEKFFFRPFRGEMDRAIIIAIGLILLLQNAVLVTAGGMPKAFASPFSGTVSVLGVTLSWERLMVVSIAFGFVLILFFLVKGTKVGKAMVAISQDREVAALQGINIDRISSFAMFLGCAFAAVAGALIGALFSVNPFMGGFALMKGIAVIILGGMGSILGAVLGGVILGLIDGIVPVFSTTHMASLIGFGFIILILLFRPQGILGREYE
ncbi:MAG: branched-chain amino acid ABC transporter permease [Desulfobacteraceae bacterium]|nr:branched-chain amino acid ABC transporter permease [Desulfobacteraceae bacterium]